MAGSTALGMSGTAHAKPGPQLEMEPVDDTGSPAGAGGGGASLSVSMPWDYAAYTARFWGGVAGWLAGGGTWDTIPWQDIYDASKD
jgi:hypothetical protein